MMALKMKQIVLAALLIPSLFAGDTVYLALLKGSNSLVYLAPDGKVLTTVPVGQHPHEMAFSPDRKLLYTTDNGTMRIENRGQAATVYPSLMSRPGRRSGTSRWADITGRMESMLTLRPDCSR